MWENLYSFVLWPEKEVMERALGLGMGWRLEAWLGRPLAR